jgi:hypothetical protein
MGGSLETSAFDGVHLSNGLWTRSVSSASIKWAAWENFALRPVTIAWFHRQRTRLIADQSEPSISQEEQSRNFDQALDWIYALARSSLRFRSDHRLWVLARQLLAVSHRGTFACYRAHRRDDRPLTSLEERHWRTWTSPRSRNRLDAGFQIEAMPISITFWWVLHRTSSETLDGPRIRFRDAPSLRTLLHPETMGTQFRYRALRAVDTSRNCQGSDLRGTL